MYDQSPHFHPTIYKGVYVEHVEFDGRARWGATYGGYPDIDDTGHGTHCAGAAAGHTYGVAKGADIIAVKVFHDDHGSASDIIYGLDYVQYDTRIRTRHSVALLPFEGPAFEPLDDAVAELTNDNIIVVTPAGNRYSDASSFSPAGAPSAITVAASNAADEQAWFSNYGDAVDIFAPGVDVISAWIGDEHAIQSASGTSSAAAYLAGLAATLLPWAELSPADMKNSLKDMAAKNVLRNVSPNTPNLLAHDGLTDI